ncbi:MAG: DUF3990 domain-containing protein [Anaerostipes sp.]
MIIYHGSSIEVNKPDIFHSRDNVDFGKGFYVTPLKEQASKWATRFKLRHGAGVLSSYEFNIEEVKEKYCHFIESEGS